MALLDVTAGPPQIARGPKLLGVPMKQVSLVTVRMLPCSMGSMAWTASTKQVAYQT
jgi:hypothetical protein